MLVRLFKSAVYLKTTYLKKWNDSRENENFSFDIFIQLLRISFEKISRFFFFLIIVFLISATFLRTFGFNVKTFIYVKNILFRN